MFGQLEGLVVATFAQACCCERHGHDQMGCIQRRLNPRRVTHQMGQCTRKARVGLKFETCDAVGPREGVAHRGHARVERAGMFFAVATYGARFWVEC